MTRSSLRHLVVFAALAAGLGARAASAQSPDDARARQLFEEGQKAITDKDFATACPKFEESYKIGGVVGALLSWADCEESRGRLATAYDLWQQGEAKLVREPDRLDFVTKRVAALKGRVPHIEVTIGQQSATDVQIELDGKPLSIARGAIAVDPGKHTLRASAKGLPAEEQTFDIGPAETKNLSVLSKPAQAGGATPTATATATTTASSFPSGAPSATGPSGMAIGGWTLGAVGLAGLIGFGVTGGLVLSKCESLSPCKAPRSDVEPINVANAVLLGVGIVGLGGGATLLILNARNSNGSAPSAAAPPRASFHLQVAPGGAYAGAQLTF